MQTLNQSSRILVAMSGGVDSAVAAFLLRQQGFSVEGLFMKNWEEDDTESYCAATEDKQDAQAVCDKLGIRLHTINFASEYWDGVFTHFLSEIKNGRTPNPDILCNKEIKFKALLDYAISLGADYIATGHYVSKAQHQQQFELHRATDLNKDQSYFLYALNQSQLAKALFPLENLTKPQVREIAKQQHFINYQKKDSTGICFIGERKFKDFLQRFLPTEPGPIVTESGKIIGQHEGLMYYTLGQRQGLNIGGLSFATNDPWYVYDKNLADNQLQVVQGNDHPLLFKQKLIASNLNWIVEQRFDSPYQCSAKIRYRQADVPCQIIFSQDKSVEVIFTTPQRAITPGQSIVFYQDHICLGGGIIERAFT